MSADNAAVVRSSVHFLHRAVISESVMTAVRVFNMGYLTIINIQSIL